MRFDSYSGAVDAALLERRLQQCQSADHDHPEAVERCARAAVDACCCACIVSEEMICNSLCSSVGEAALRGGFGY